MSETETLEVVQGRLGWEVGDVSMAAVAELTPHPKNVEIYGESEPGEQFAESVREKGVLEPLVIKGDKTILSGHRRWAAARKEGVEQVPVRIAEFDSELAEREALIEFNRQREKTFSQRMSEADEIAEIVEQRAQDRKKHKNTEDRETFPDAQRTDKRRSRDEIAETIGIGSGRTYGKARTVWDAANDGDETAQKQVEKIDSGEQTITGAKRVVEKTAEDEDDGERVEDSGNDSSTDVDLFTSQETDEWSSPREVVEPIAESIDEFALDPCSGAEQSPFADEAFTEDDDGLSQPWHGDVWVNPPYSDMATWTEKAIAESGRDDVERVVYLCKGDSSTQWWQSAMGRATAVCAIDGRLSFGDGGNAAPFASHIFVFGALSGELLDVLREQGALLAEFGGGVGGR